MANGVLVQLYLTVGSQTHLVIISPDPKYIFGIDVLSNWKTPHIGSLAYVVMVITVVKTEWKPLKLKSNTTSKEGWQILVSLSRKDEKGCEM